MRFLMKLARMYLVVIAMTVAAIIFFFMQMTVTKEIEVVNSFLVDTSACRIPDFDPFDKSIDKLVKRTYSLKCEGKPAITTDDVDMIRVNWNAAEKYSDGLKYCKYKPITRGDKQSDSHFQFGAESSPFSKDVKVQSEFVRVQCFSSSDKLIYTNFHTFVLPNRTDLAAVNKKLEVHKRNHKPAEVLNILMVGVDSVSRLNFMRQMPQTRNFLLDDLQAIEMLGYTKVADNTFVNIIPMMIGKFLEELPWNETLSDKPFDKYNFLWKNFSQNGYKTMYAEDAPDIAIFNFQKKGFKKPPGHHYNRALSVAMEKESSVWSHYHSCVGDRLETEIVLNYAYQFSKAYSLQPHFGFTFITRLTHDNINSAGAADDSYVKFLKKMRVENRLENTILIFFSDHGIRFGQIRNTYVGKLEERMPFMFFVLPKWFKEKYPRIVRNMNINSNRLTTPFDIHETLKGVLYFTGQAQKGGLQNRGISLFDEVPENRTCENAGILPHWCMCLDTEDLPKSSEIVKSSAHTVIQIINKKLAGHTHICHVLQLQEISRAAKMIANNNVLRFKDSVNDVINRTVVFGKKVKALVMVQMTFVTSPGLGMFEATVNHNENNNECIMAGDISRINKYGDQSWCIDNFELKKYCVCKQSKPK